MYKFILKVFFYSLVAYALLGIGAVTAGSALSPLFFAVSLAVTNTLLRPLVSAIALALNVITFGIASVFGNILMIIIANSIFFHLGGLNFLTLLAAAVLIMVCDYFISKINRKKYYTKTT